MKKTDARKEEIPYPCIRLFDIIHSMLRIGHGESKPEERERDMTKKFHVRAWVTALALMIAVPVYAAAPTGPTSIGSTSHSTSVSSTNNKVTVTWTAAADTDTDLDGYMTLWDNTINTVPVTKTLSSTATSTTSSALSDGSWYFHIRAVDAAYNLGTTYHLGPFVIDTKPDITSISPTSAGNGSTTAVTIYGTDFMTGASAKVGNTELTNETVVSTTEITATVPAGIAVGTYDVTVTNTNTKSGTLTNGYSVTSDNSAPVVDAGANQTVNVDSTVNCTVNQNTGSYPNTGSVTDADGDTLTYTWSVTANPNGANTTINSSTTQTATFVPDVGGSYTIKLAVSDGTVTVNDTFTLTVNSSGNTTPIANAGTDQTLSFVNANADGVTLDGSASSDANSDTLTYAWTIAAVPSTSAVAALTNGTTVSPSFTPDVTGTYRFTLVVNDGTVDSASDSVTITIVDAVPITLAEGWNLISLPLEPSNTAIDVVTAGIADSCVSIWAFDPSTYWTSYFPGGSGNSLTTMESGKGYWVNMSSAATLNVGGSAPTAAISLADGWNLVGFGGADSTAVDTSLSGVTYVSVWAFDPSTYWSSNFSGGSSNSLSTLSTTLGYWIDVTGTATWNQ